MRNANGEIPTVIRAIIIGIVMTGVYLNFLIMGPVTIAAVAWLIRLVIGMSAG